LKILYLNPGGSLGGAEHALLFLMQSMRIARPQWNLELITGGDGPLLERAARLDIRATAVPFPRALNVLGDAGDGGRDGAARALQLAADMGRAGLPSLAYLRRLRKLIVESAPDIIHSNGFKMHILGARAQIRGSRLIWHVHDFVGARLVMSRLMRAHADRPALAIANSASVADDLRTVCGRHLAIVPIHNAIDLEVFNPMGNIADLDALAGLPPAREGTIRIGLVATMARWKGHPVFLRAIKEVAQTAKVRAYVVGGPIYERNASQFQIEELQNLAAELGIGGQVGFTGHVVNPADVMRALDVVIHASVAPEPFGLVIGEAMACGRATIAAASGGAAEIIEPGRDAIVHQPGDAADLARAILDLARDSELRTRLGSAARLAAVRRFGRERMTAQILPIYEGLVRAAA
jgi:glycosyltransferase involved in cell wall biosynthesis